MLNSYDTITFSYNGATAAGSAGDGRRLMLFYSVFVIPYMLVWYTVAAALRRRDNDI